MTDPLLTRPDAPTLPWSYDHIDAATVADLDADTLTEWLRLAWERGYSTRQLDRNAGMPGTVWQSVNPYEKPAVIPEPRQGWLDWLSGAWWRRS